MPAVVSEVLAPRLAQAGSPSLADDRPAGAVVNDNRREIGTGRRVLPEEVGQVALGLDAQAQAGADDDRPADLLGHDLQALRDEAFVGLLEAQEVEERRQTDGQDDDDDHRAADLHRQVGRHRRFHWAPGSGRPPHVRPKPGAGQ